MPKLELSLLHWLMTNLSLLEFFQQQGSFYFGSQPNRIPLLRKINVELQILTVLLSSGAESLHRVKTRDANVMVEREVRQWKRRGRQVTKKENDREEKRQEAMHSLPESSCFLTLSLVPHPSTFQSSVLEFKYLKMCAIWRDSLLENIKRI